MPRIWLDCSSLGSWNLKHLTGIQRTVLGICKGFRHHGREPILFSFDEVDHYFRRIDLQELPDLIRLNMESSEWISMEQELAKETIGPVTAELRQPNPGLFPPSQKDRLKRRVLGEDATAEDLRRSISACKLSLWHLQSSGRSWLAARRLRRNQLLIDAAPEAAPECSVKENDIRRELQPGDLICCFGSENYQMEEAISASKHLRQAGGKVVRIIYDMIPATQPQWINEKVCHDFCSSIRKAIETADLLLTISTYSQLDLQRFASDSGISLPPVQTIRLGDDVVHERKRIPKEPIQAERPQRPFFLCIGTVEPRKNHQLLYAAWRRMAELSSETCPDLVCIGVHNIMSSQVIRELSQDKLAWERFSLPSMRAGDCLSQRVWPMGKYAWLPMLQAFLKSVT
jgi:glycosyltransferase involved in cell wall biosynthesis